jgi:hypothetical protein
MPTVTGEVIVQPAEQLEPLHVAELVGAFASAVAVKAAVGPVRPAPFVAETLPVAFDVAELENV